jgi:hypothetical protein
MKLGSTLAMILLAVVSIGHLARIVWGVELVAGGTEIPMWVSYMGCLIPGAIVFLLWREACDRNS